MMTSKNQIKNETPVFERRLGRFELKADMVREHWKKLPVPMQPFVIVGAITIFPGDTIEYTALSNLFDEIPEGEKPPFYDIVLDNWRVSSIARQK